MKYEHKIIVRDVHLTRVCSYLINILYNMCENVNKGKEIDVKTKIDEVIIVMRDCLHLFKIEI
jgi:hypothetical protein